MKLMNMVSVLVVALGVPSMGLAQGGDAEQLRSEATDAMSQIVDRYLSAKEGRVSEAYESPEACTRTLAKLRQTSVKTITHPQFKELGGTPVKGKETFELTLARAGQICTEYGTFYKFREHVQLFNDILGSVSLMKPSMSPSPDFVENTLAKVKQCQVAMEELLALGIPASFAFEINGTKYTVGNIRAQICDIVPGIATRYTADQAEAKRQKEEPFLKAGLKGDRLELLVTYGSGVRMPGGAASKDWRKYVSPAALFVVLTDNKPDAQGHVVHIVNKYQFKGPKLIKSSTKNYRLPRGVDPGAKHFR